ncbi:hypothetical protein BHM03_00047106 [Ensete ventricosum]|nr:hypothetical protein BHM03_00047106 [Ensete ventricosum]
MHCVVGRLGLFLHSFFFRFKGFFFRFKGFFRCFIVLILRWFNHEEPALFAVMFAALRGLDGSRGGSRPQHGWSRSDPCPSYLVVQLFFLDMREGNRRHKSIRLPRLYFSDLRL